MIRRQKRFPMFDAHVLKVFIASPSDTTEERDAVERALHGWNGSRAEREQIILSPWRWETHSVPELGGSAQSIINSQAVDDCDIVIAVFDARLGTATEDAVSGTAEEIDRASKAGKQVHVWFSNEPLPRDIAADELTRLREFKKRMESSGLLGEYANIDDLQHQVRNAIEHDLGKMDLGRITVRSGNAVQARKVVSAATPVTALGAGIWRVAVSNDSGAPITALSVGVVGHDSAGNLVAVTPAKDKINLADVAGKFIGEMMGGGFASSMGAANAGMAGQYIGQMAQSRLQGQLQDQMADAFETAVAGQANTAMAFATEPAAKDLSVTIDFDDENGVRWRRVDNEQPVQI